MEPNYKLVSLDVTSLFTNVPIDLAMESIGRRWNPISRNTLIPLEEFKSAAKFVLNSTFFTFNNKCYEQIFGTYGPYGPSVSGDCGPSNARPRNICNK